MPSAARPIALPFALPTYVGPATGDPTPAIPSHRPALALSARTAVDAALGALGDAVADLGDPQLQAAHDAQVLDREAWADGPRGRWYAGDREPRWRERGDGPAHDGARDAGARIAVDVAAGEYARALRAEGGLLATALADVRARVQAAAGRLSAVALAAVQHDAAERCLKAYNARRPAR
ncbi:MAG TPA: hypothetical protein VGD56_01010 [Gemmatirosa sp.]